MKRLSLARYVRVLVGVALLILGAARAGAASITTFGPPLPMTFGLTASPPGTFEGFNAYRFNLSDYFPPTPNALPQCVFTENEFNTNLVMIAGFGAAGLVDPILVDQTLEFDVTGEFWRHHLTLTLHPKSFIIFSSDSVGLKGFVQHLVAPHEGEVASGVEVMLEASIAGNAQVTPPPDFFLTGEQLRRELRRHNVDLPAEGRYGFDAKSKIHPHGPDEDTAIALLVGKAPGANAETFDWYVVGTAALHPVPEPSGFVLLGSGVIMIVLRVQRRRNGAALSRGPMRRLGWDRNSIGTEEESPTGFRAMRPSEWCTCQNQLNPTID